MRLIDILARWQQERVYLSSSRGISWCRSISWLDGDVQHSRAVPSRINRFRLVATLWFPTSNRPVTTVWIGRSDLKRGGA